MRATSRSVPALMWRRASSRAGPRGVVPVGCLVAADHLGVCLLVVFGQYDAGFPGSVCDRPPAHGAADQGEVSHRYRKARGSGVAHRLHSASPLRRRQPMLGPATRADRLPSCRPQPAQLDPVRGVLRAGRRFLRPARVAAWRTFRAQGGAGSSNSRPARRKGRASESDRHGNRRDLGPGGRCLTACPSSDWRAAP